MATMPEEIRSLVERLSPDLQRQVLKFTKVLARTHEDRMSLPTTPLPPGTPGTTFLRFKLPSEDIEAMERALVDCERIGLFRFGGANYGSTFTDR